jgi:hypothetical protein
MCPTLLQLKHGFSLDGHVGPWTWRWDPQPQQAASMAAKTTSVVSGTVGIELVGRLITARDVNAANVIPTITRGPQFKLVGELKPFILTATSSTDNK